MAGSNEFDSGLNYGCLQCRVGSEEQLIETIRRRVPEVKAVVARRKHIVCKNGVHRVDSLVEFPGYVFFSARGDFDIGRLLGIKGVMAVVRDSDGSWMLRGEERALAALLFSNDHFRNIF